MFTNRPIRKEPCSQIGRCSTRGPTRERALRPHSRTCCEFALNSHHSLPVRYRLETDWTRVNLKLQPFNFILHRHLVTVNTCSQNDKVILCIMLCTDRAGLRFEGRLKILNLSCSKERRGQRTSLLRAAWSPFNPRLGSEWLDVCSMRTPLWTHSPR